MTDNRVQNFGMIARGKRRKTNTVTAVYRSGDGFRVVCDTHHESASREMRKEAFRIARDPSLFCEHCAKKIGDESPRKTKTVDDLIGVSRNLRRCDVGEHRTTNVTKYGHADGGESLDCCYACAQTQTGRERIRKLNAELKRARRSAA